MDFWKAVLGLVRRWSVGLPILVVSVGLGVLAYSLVPTHYTSSATMVLTTPISGGTLSQDPARPSGLSNPLLNFGEGLRTAATVIIQALNTPDVQELLCGKDGSTTVIINNGSTDPNLLGTNGPFIQAASESTSAANAQNVVVKARQLVQEELARRQEALGAPSSTYIMVVDVVPPSAAEAQRGAKVQAAGVAVFLGLIFGFGGAYVAFHVLGLGGRRKVAAEGVENEVPQVGRADGDGSDFPTVQFAQVHGAGDNGAVARAVAGTLGGKDVSTNATAATTRLRAWRHPVFNGPIALQTPTVQPQANSVPTTNTTEPPAAGAGR